VLINVRIYLGFVLVIIIKVFFIALRRYFCSVLKDLP